MFSIPVIVAMAGGCSKDQKATNQDDLTVLMTSRSTEDRLAASKRLAAQGAGAIPPILEAFTKAEGQKEAQLSLLDAVFRMKPSDTQFAALEKMAAQTKDNDVREKASGFAQQLKTSH
jgi:hypothetical protein